VLTDGTVKHIHGIGHPVSMKPEILSNTLVPTWMSQSANVPKMPSGHTKQNLRLLVDTIPGLVVTTTPAGEIEHLNRKVLEYFEKTPEELANWRPATRFTRMTFLSRSPP